MAADSRELAGVRQHLRAAREMSLPVDFSLSGVLAGQEVTLAANGPGPRLAAAAVEAACAARPHGAVLNTGYCGALNPTLRVGDIFIPARVRDVASAMEYAVDPPRTCPPHRTGILLSQDRVAGTAEEKRALRTAGGDVVEMEAAGAAGAAVRLGLPFYCIRVVSDEAAQSFGLDFNKLRRPDGRFDTPRILLAAFRSGPRGLAGLWSLSRQGARASRELGGFLANCRF